jgi:hypothetical protein
MFNGVFKGVVAASIKKTIIFDPSYQAVLDYASTIPTCVLPNTTQQVKQNQLVIDLKAAGIWNKLDTFAVFATNGNSDFALIDWKRLTGYTNNNCTFTTNGGFVGNGTNAYIDTNFNPSIGTNNYTLGDANRSMYMDLRSGNTPMDGISLASRNRTIFSSSPAQQVNQGTSSNSGGFTNWLNDGLHMLNRTNSTTVIGIIDTTSTTRSSSMTIIENSNQWILRASTTYAAHRVRIYSMGASLVAEANAYNTAINNYITSL